MAATTSFGFHILLCKLELLTAWPLKDDVRKNDLS